MNGFFCKVVAIHFCLFTLALIAAPVPKGAGKVVPDHLIIGKWKMEWLLFEVDATFGKDGTYRCNWLGNVWVGSWRIDEEQLIVAETVKRADGKPPEWWFVWKVKLDRGKTSGKFVFPFSLHGHFSLKPIKGKDL